MKPTRLNDDAACFLCDWWWAILLLLLLAGAAVWYFTPHLGSGDVQATLRWKGHNDLDLYVIDPNGFQISYSNSASPSGGRLDVDGNANCVSHLSSNPVENIFWPSHAAPHGTYKVAVSYYLPCTEPVPTDFTVRVLVDGKVKNFTGRVLQKNDWQIIYEFTR